MPRKPSAERLTEYEALKRFFVHWTTQIVPSPYFDLAHPHHPVNALAAIEQKFSFSQAFSGLRQAVNDTLEDSQDWDKAQISAADVSLTQAGAPTLSSLIIAQSRQFKAIARRGRIRDDTEYYLVSAALSNTDSQRAKEETDLLESILGAYEPRD